MPSQLQLIVAYENLNNSAARLLRILSILTGEGFTCRSRAGLSGWSQTIRFPVNTSRLANMTRHLAGNANILKYMVRGQILTVGLGQKRIRFSLQLNSARHFISFHLFVFSITNVVNISSSDVLFCLLHNITLFIKTSMMVLRAKIQWYVTSWRGARNKILLPLNVADHHHSGTYTNFVDSSNYYISNF